MAVVRPALVGASTTRLLVALPPQPGQYSVGKLLQWHEYTIRASPWHVMLVLTTIPIPGLVAAILPGLIPLCPLHVGPTVGSYVHLFTLNAAIAWGTIIPITTLACIPPSFYSSRDALLVTVICGGLQVVIMSQVYPLWRFPVPFAWVVGANFWVASMFLAHLLVLRSKCWERHVLLNAIRLNQAGYCLELAQVAIYPGVSVLFDHVNETHQIVITLLFPFIKYALKRALQFATRHIQDHHSVTVVSAVEIPASLYQAIIMQSVPSKIATVIIMTIDVLQGLYAIKFMLDRHRSLSACQRDTIIATVSAFNCNQEVVPRAAPSAPSNSTTGPLVQSEGRPKVQVKKQAIAVNETLKFVQIAETIVLLEYYEVVVPLTNCVFILIASHFKGAFYNTKLTPFYHDRDKLTAAVTSIILYSILQGLSYVAVHFVMKYRYGLSASTLLAFVLEHNRRPIQAKLIAWLPIVMHFSTVHYGTDFSFKFDFERWEQW